MCIYVAQLIHTYVYKSATKRQCEKIITFSQLSLHLHAVAARHVSRQVCLLTLVCVISFSMYEYVIVCLCSLCFCVIKIKCENSFTHRYVCMLYLLPWQLATYIYTRMYTYMHIPMYIPIFLPIKVVTKHIGFETTRGSSTACCYIGWAEKLRKLLTTLIN